jgi:tetratricopeptide (TPR) repeat protein
VDPTFVSQAVDRSNVRASQRRRLFRSDHNNRYVALRAQNQTVALRASMITISSVSEIMPKAVSSATTALQLDDTLAESHASIALASHIYAWDWAIAERHYRRSIEVNPRFATAHHWYAVFLAEMGRAEDSISEIRQAQRLDPVSLIIGADSGMILYLARDYDGAVKQCRATLDMDPNYFRARMWLGCAYEQRGLYEKALTEYETARALDQSPYVLEWLARLFAVSGNRSATNKVLDELTRLSFSVCRFILSGFGVRGAQKQKAIALLERACEERSCWLSRLRVDPIFDSLRPAPGFERVLMKAGIH